MLFIRDLLYFQVEISNHLLDLVPFPGIVDDGVPFQ